MDDIGNSKLELIYQFVNVWNSNRLFIGRIM